tara:strand:- start:2211 stop:3440 length:1230 start_codon:yes stop_codon:yes gene_type:complete
MAVRYMGSKKALAPEISELISERHPNSAVLDVFAGMCAVGTEVVGRHKLYTNDVHAYAATIASALFTGPINGATSITARAELLRHFNKNKRVLEDSANGRLQKEDQYFRGDSSSANFRPAIEFNDRELQRPPARKLPNLPTIAKYKETPKTFPYCLATSYFSSAYFGIRQAIEIDSIRYAIDQAPKKNRERYLAALVDAASHCAAAPGHFAQFLIPRDRKTFDYIARIRNRSVLERFFLALDIMPKPKCHSRSSNRVFQYEAVELLQAKSKKFSNEDLVIYADPPYSRAQYSRYYHVLETLVLYDYPACRSKGRYREDRFHTDFSRVSRVVDAMDEFSAAASKTGAALYLSYPQNGLLTKAGADVREILRQHYKSVSTATRRNLQHSTMGGAPGSAAQSVWEDIFYATN